MDTFDRRVMIFRAIAVSQGAPALTRAMVTGQIPRRDLPAARAARLLATRSSGRDRRERVAIERAAFEHGPCAPGCPCPPTA